MELMRWLGLIVSILVILILVQNLQVVSYRILFWNISMSKIIIPIVSLLAGLIIGIIMAKRI